MAIRPRQQRTRRTFLWCIPTWYLGAISPAAYAFVLAPPAVPYLGIVAQLGVALYMFLVGLLESLVLVVLLPAFFAFAGMRTVIGLVSGWEEWVACGLIIVVATAGMNRRTVLRSACC